MTLYTHTLTYISLVGQSVTYRIYRSDDLIFDHTEIIGKLEFPYITQNAAVPINIPDYYKIEATIFGTVEGFSQGVTLFQGVVSTRLTVSTPNNVSISMLYTGRKKLNGHTRIKSKLSISRTIYWYYNYWYTYIFTS